MIASVYAALGLLLATAAIALGDLVSEEIRGWLGNLPRVILRLAAARLDPAQRIFIYEEEWLPELCYILRGAETRPITRLLTGMRFSVSLLVSQCLGRHLRRHFQAPPVIFASPKDPSIASFLDDWGRELASSPEWHYLKIVPGIRIPRRRLCLGDIAMTRGQFKALRDEPVIIVVPLGHGQAVPMTERKFYEIADKLEGLAARLGRSTDDVGSDDL